MGARACQGGRRLARNLPRVATSAYGLSRAELVHLPEKGMADLDQRAVHNRTQVCDYCPRVGNEAPSWALLSKPVRWSLQPQSLCWLLPSQLYRNQQLLKTSMKRGALLCMLLKLPELL